MSGDRWLGLMTDQEMGSALGFTKVGESWIYHALVFRFGERFDNLNDDAINALRGQLACDFMDELHSAYIQCADYSPHGWRPIFSAGLADRDRKIHFWVG